MAHRFELIRGAIPCFIAVACLSAGNSTHAQSKWTGGTRILNIRGDGKTGFGTKTPESMFNVGAARITTGDANAHKARVFQVSNDNSPILTTLGNGETVLSASTHNGAQMGLKYKSTVPNHDGEVALHRYHSGYPYGDFATNHSVFPRVVFGSKNEHLYVGTQTPHQVNLSTDNKVRMTIMEDGRVGIGTVPDANSKLHIAGHARVDGELAVASVKTRTWTVAPDYVFEKGYKLASLQDVDAFVKKHKHLPEVPSAKEFKEKGMDLAEMNFTLLKKVEELALHAIEQSGKIEALEKAMASMKTCRDSRRAPARVGEEIPC